MTNFKKGLAASLIAATVALGGVAPASAGPASTAAGIGAVAGGAGALYAANTAAVATGTGFTHVLGWQISSSSVATKIGVVATGAVAGAIVLGGIVWVLNAIGTADPA